ncbi:hypothetical protein UAM5_00005 [Ralstonia phage UAM5]|nr:hypothetical protein UAM5_00005 [Ralstonia phage UAM5]
MTIEQAATRQAEQANAATAIEQALAQQPQITSGLDYLGEGHLGDLRVEFYGKVHRFGRRIEVDLEEIALAGTTLSMNTLVSVHRWRKIEDELQYSIASKQ